MKRRDNECKSQQSYAQPHLRAAPNPALGTALLIIFLLIFFGVTLFWMYSIKLLILPDSVAELLGIGDKGTDEPLPWDTGELSGAIKNGKSSEKIELTFDISYENLRAALINESVPEGYYQKLRICYYDKETEISHRVVLQRHGEKFRIEKYSSNISSSQDISSGIEKLIIADNTTLYYHDKISGESRSIPRGAGITPESEAGLPSVDDLLLIIAEKSWAEDTEDSFNTDNEQIESDMVTESNSDFETVASAEFDQAAQSFGEDKSKSRYSDIELTMLNTNNGIVYFAAFNDEWLGLREEYYISLEHRVIISHRTLKDGKIIYSCETLSFSTNPSLYSDESDYSTIQK
jgi:hypothetical protein